MGNMVSYINGLYPPFVVLVLYGFLGLLVGSFVNVLIIRVPVRESLMTRSHCVSCDAQVEWYDNFPVISWVVLKGKCRRCKFPISKQYPFIEVFTSISWVVITLLTGTLLIPSPFVVSLYVLISLSIALSVIDFKTLTLPNPLVLAFTIVAAVGVLSETFVRTNTDVWISEFAVLENVTAGSLIRGVVVMLIFGFLYLSLLILSGGRWVGFGDVKLVPALGLVSGYLGVGSAVVAFVFPYLIAGLPLMVLMVSGKIKKGSHVPFGPSLLAGFWVAVFFGESISNFYLNFSGLNF